MDSLEFDVPSSLSIVSAYNQLSGKVAGELRSLLNLTYIDHTFLLRPAQISSVPPYLTLDLYR